MSDSSDDMEIYAAMLDDEDDDEEEDYYRLIAERDHLRAELAATKEENQLLREYVSDLGNRLVEALKIKKELE